MYTAYQTGYFAHWLSLEGKAEKSLTQTIVSAKVDMNPHQVEAALFALEDRLLADIEAALEMNQQRECLFAIRWQLRGKSS